MKPKSADEMKNNVMLRKNYHIISLQMLLILLKKVVIYGNYKSLNSIDYVINDDDYRKVIMLQLLVVDEVSQKNKLDFDADHFIYASYHLNHQRRFANEFMRMYNMMECLSVDKQNFDEDIRKEYRDYYCDFTSKYGITPTEFSSLLFWELHYYFSEKNALSKSVCWRNIDLIYNSAKKKDTISKVIDILKIEPLELKEWAKETEMNEWDFSYFYSYPFISNGESEYISISDVTLINSFFEKMFWLIRDCYPEKDSRAMSFFGRLFERYIQNATRDACKDAYKYIDEFKVPIKKKNRKSSDAYIRKGDNLLIVEAKGFSVLVDCMAKNERIEDNNKKLFIDPVLQADNFFDEFGDKNEEFKGVKNAFVISVTLDNINAVPNYYNAIHKEISNNKKSELIKYFFNFSIEEYEMLLYLIEKGEDIFLVLHNYFTTESLSPFSNYLEEAFGNINMTDFMEQYYKMAIDKMKSILQ